jgi:hypothetical protein
MRKSGLTVLLAALPLFAQPPKLEEQALRVAVEGLDGEEKKPIAGVLIEVWKLRPRMGLPWALPTQTATTRQDGVAWFPGLSPGEYTVRAVPPPAAEGTPGWMPAFLGESPDQASAQRFTSIRGGTELEFSIRLKKGMASTLKGLALTEDGRPAAGAKIRLGAKDLPALVLAETTAGQDGRFAFQSLWPRDYEVRAESADASADLDAAVMEGREAAVTLRLEGLFEVAGQVDWKREGESIVELPGVRVHLAPAGASVWNESSALVQKDNSFQLKGVRAGRYRIAVSQVPEGYYLDSVRLSGIEAMGETVELHRGYGPIVLRLEPRPGIVNGRVELKGEDATVILCPVEEKLRRYPEYIRSAKTGSESRFSFEGLRPGEYYLWAFDLPEARDFEDTLLVEKLRPHAAKVRVERGETATVELKKRNWLEAAY